MNSAAIDLGKSRCRLLVTDGVTTRKAVGAGAPGLTSAGGVESALAAIVTLLEAGTERMAELSVGAAGAWAAPAAAIRLARELSERTGARTVVTSDVVTAHAGALEGEPGVLLIAGTGAAALGVDAEDVRLIDGWGPELGDLGSGSWLGREGLRAVLSAENGLGPQTVLTSAAHAHTAPHPDVHSWLAAAAPVARQLATFAPAVLDAAAEGDPVAGSIAAEAVRLLTASAVAASDTSTSVVVHGGLTEHHWFRGQLENGLQTAGRTPTQARGDALAGALLLAGRTDLPHERYLHRAG